MTLTTEQIEAVQHGNPVAVAPPEVGVDCVLLRKDIYDRVKNLILDDSDFDPAEAYPFVNDAMAEDDANDPWLDSYQSQ